MRSIYFSLPLIAIISILLLSACTGSDNIDSKSPRESRSGISNSGKYISGSGAYRGGNREKSGSRMGNPNAEKPSGIDSVSGTTIPVVSSKPIADPIPTISRESVISKNASYSTDHGKERVSVRYDISLKTDGTISSVTAVMLSGDHESRQYISRFNNAARSKIVGKKISNLSLVALGGASDTTNSFSQVIVSL